MEYEGFFQVKCRINYGFKIGEAIFHILFTLLRNRLALQITAYQFIYSFLK